MTMIINSQIINLGGVERPVIPFEQLAQAELGSQANGNPPITKFQYACLILNNLGYDRTPNNTDWLDNKMPVESVGKDNPLDYPITNNPLMINKEEMSLWDLLVVIRNWGRGQYEEGTILDTSASFKLPSNEEIAFDLENGILIKRTAATTITPTHWSSSDIINRRLHNICPHINKDYFHNCIRNFSEYAKVIKVNTPYVVFAAAIIDPNIIMSMIRNSEMMASQNINKEYGGYTALRSDYKTVLEFKKIFDAKVAHLYNIYMKYGAAGFVRMLQTEQKPLSPWLTTNNEVPDMIAGPNTTAGIDPEDAFSHLSEAERRDEVDRISIDGKIKNEIFTYVDRKSFPDYLLESVLVKDARGNTVRAYDKRLYPTLKRIYSLLTQLQIYYPEMVNAKEKWIISKPFYISSESFGLFNQFEGLYLLAYPEMTAELLSPKEAVEKYKAKYDTEVLLDPEEIGGTLESPECDNTVLVDSKINIVDPGNAGANIAFEDVRPVKEYELDKNIGLFLSTRPKELDLLNYGN